MGTRSVSAMPSRGFTSRQTHLDLATVACGKVVEIKTGQSVWHLVRTINSSATANRVRGVMIMTNSRAFGIPQVGPDDMEVDRMLVLNENMHYGQAGFTWRADRGFTGNVRSVRVDGSLVMGS